MPPFHISQETGSTIGQPGLYEKLLQDIAQRRRKYQQNKGKGKATQGVITKSLFPQVAYRPLADYERLVSGGGGVWTN